jgi:hypothetical protein
MLTVLVLLTLLKTKIKKYYFRVSVVPYSIHWNTAEPISSNQPITGVVSQLVQACVRLFAQAQLEETQYRTGLRGGGTFQAKMLAKSRLLTRYDVCTQLPNFSRPPSPEIWLTLKKPHSATGLP